MKNSNRQTAGKFVPYVLPSEVVDKLVAVLSAYRAILKREEKEKAQAALEKKLAS